MNPDRVWLRITLLVLSTLVLQVGVASRLRILGVAPDLPLLVTLAVGLTGGPDRGAIVGFLTGISIDMVLPPPMGISALSLCLTGYIVGRLQGTVIRASWWLPIAGWLGGSVLGVGLFVLIGEIVGVENLVNQRVLLVMGLVAGFNAVLGPVALRVARWANNDAGQLRPVLR